jgi:hypothetical protein
MSDVGIGGSGSASTSVTGFSVTRGGQAGEAERKGGPTVHDGAPAPAATGSAAR